MAAAMVVKGRGDSGGGDGSGLSSLRESLGVCIKFKTKRPLSDPDMWR